MATAAELRALLADIRRANDIARRFGGARVRRTVWGMETIDLGKSSDPALFWSRAWDEHCLAGESIARAEAAAADPREREEREIEAEHYRRMHGSEAHLLETREELRQLAALPRRAPVGRDDHRRAAEPLPEPIPAEQALAGSDLDFLDKSSAPALPPRRRRGDVIRVRVEGRAQPSGGAASRKIIRGN